MKSYCFVCFHMKAPPPRHRHVAIPIGNDAILIHGGETFDGRSKKPVADLILGTAEGAARLELWGLTYIMLMLMMLGFD